MKRWNCLFGSALAAGCLLAAIAGCSNNFDYGETGKITGRLTLAGKPLQQGHAVVFMEPMKGYLAYGQTDAEGRFEVRSWNNGDMPVGPYKVQISFPEQPAAPAELSPEQRFDHPELVEGPPKGKLTFPRKYASFATSGLQFQVQPGMNDFEIDLK